MLDDLDGDLSRQEPGRCDWCGSSSGNQYLVVAQTQVYAVCPICWGRSPTYLELTQEGVRHEAALTRLGIASPQ